MKLKNKKILLITLGVLLVGIISVSYAFFTSSGKQSEFNTFSVGVCLSVTITEESDAINLTSVKPQSIEEGLNNTPYTFTIRNNCDNNAPYQISLESLDLKDNTLGGDYIDVSLEDSEGRTTTNILSNLTETERTLDNSYDARRIVSGILEGNSTTNYKLRLWLAYDATIEQAEKVYTSKIVVSAKDNVEVDEDTFNIAFSEEASTVGNNGWYKSYTGRINVSNSKDTNLKAKYCIGASKCTPSIEATLSNNSFNYEYPNGESTLCVQGIDSKGNRSKIICNEEKKVDNELPIVTIDSTSSTTDSITINVTGNDEYSKVARYYYKIGDGEYKESTSSTRTFTSDNSGITINDNTDYNISVYIVDTAGNESEAKITSVKTKQITGSKTILDSLGTSIKTQTYSVPNFANTATTNEGVFKTSDGMYGGDTYYWRGAVDNNHVIFANLCWKIIRINGDASIRLIYNGTPSGTGDARACKQTSDSTSIAVTNQKYGISNAFSYYVGWTYEVGKQRPDNNLTATSSVIKTQTDTWYENNITKKGFDGKVATGKFCNDRSLASGASWDQNGSSFQYAGYDRSGAKSASSVKPVTSCSYKDIYNMKVGTITMDEVIMAGGKLARENSSYYLYNGQWYWTMTPYYWGTNRPEVLTIINTGYLYSQDVYVGVNNAKPGIRPVINLLPSTTFKTGGNGQANTPYIVS